MNLRDAVAARLVQTFLLFSAILLLVSPSSATIWYVNDTSTAGDSFTSAVGNTANNGLTPSTPKRYLNDVEGLLSAGDTILVTRGSTTSPTRMPPRTPRRATILYRGRRSP